MNDSLYLLLIIVVAAGVGGVVGFFLSNFKNKASTSTLEARQSQLNERINELQSTNQQLAAEKEKIREAKEFTQNQLSIKGVEYESLLQKNIEQKEEVSKLQEKFAKDFENLANKVLDATSNKFANQNKDSLKLILDPLNEKIKNFEKKIDETNKESIVRHTSLKSELSNLKDLNKTIGEEAQNLTRALKSDKKLQGSWGELVLETVLEKSGLRKDIEFSKQESSTDETGKRLQPDYIINLPDNRKIIVDSKVSLVAYEKFINEDDEELQKKYLKQHLISLWEHVKDLSSKKYQNIYQIESPDYVLLFMPIETAFSTAINEKPRLYDEAFSLNIVIVTPSTLLATLKTISTIWQNDRQRRNTIEIAKQASALYDKFVGLLEDYGKIERQLITVQNTLGNSKKKLTGPGNLIKRVENLRELGLTPSKRINTNLIESNKSDSAITDIDKNDLKSDDD